MIRATVTEIYDMNTHINELGLIGVHTPRYDLLFKHLMGHFVQFKRWKYDGASISLIPAAMLPQDVAGVSLGAGDQQVDPRDVFNPILHKGFTGESLGAFLDKYLTLNSSRGDSLDYALMSERNSGGDNPDFEQAYYQMLTQGGFKKMMPMSSIRNLKVYPLVYDVATTRQLAGSWRGAHYDAGDIDSLLGEPFQEVRYIQQDVSSNPELYQISPSMAGVAASDGGENQISNPVEMGRDYYGASGENTFGFANVPFITPRKRKLGWMDTLQKVMPIDPSVNPAVDPQFNTNSEPFTFAQLPKLFEYLFVTPPSYFTKLYYRMIVRHHVSFAGQRSAIGASNAISSLQTNYYNFMEQLPSTTSSDSIETLGADVTKVVDGMNAS